MHLRKLPTSLFILLLTLAGCGVFGGDAERGRKIFSAEEPISAVNFACIECHAVEPDGATGFMGQNLANIANRAGSTVPGQSAETYLRIAILDPDAYLSGGYQEGIHPRTYADALSDRDVADLIAYLMTLRSGEDP
ncbi:MAG: c-type cytochrome [Oscillochloris sp.]|nr:c-type cytochrome [Oscillochloris sp.]